MNLDSFSFSPNDPADAVLLNAVQGKRISPAEALLLYKSGDFLKIQMAARFLREKFVLIQKPVTPCFEW